MLLLRARERDIIGNTILESMVEAERRLEEQSEAIVLEADL